MCLCFHVGILDERRWNSGLLNESLTFKYFGLSKFIPDSFASLWVLLLMTIELVRDWVRACAVAALSIFSCYFSILLSLFITYLSECFTSILSAIICFLSFVLTLWIFSSTGSSARSSYDPPKLASLHSLRYWSFEPRRIHSKIRPISSTSINFSRTSASILLA